MTGIDRIVLRWFCLKSNQAVILENVYLMCLCMFVPHLLSNASSTAPNWQYCGSRSAGSSKLTEIRATVRPGSAVCPTSGLCLVSTSVCLGPIHLAMCPNRYYIFSKDSIENSESSNFDPSPFLSSCCAQSNFDLSWLIDYWWFIMVDKSSTFRKGIWYPIRPRNLGHGHRQVTSMLRQLFHAQELALVAAFSDRSSCFLWNMGKSWNIFGCIVIYNVIIRHYTIIVINSCYYHYFACYMYGLYHYIAIECLVWEYGGNCIWGLIRTPKMEYSHKTRLR